jgi:hypothetical protein
MWLAVKYEAPISLKTTTPDATRIGNPNKGADPWMN